MVLVLRSFYDKKLFQCIFFRICWRKSKIVTYGQNTYSLHALKELIYLKDQNFFNNPFQLLQWLHGKHRQHIKCCPYYYAKFSIPKPPSIIYCIPKKSSPISYSKLLYKMGPDFFDIHTVYTLHVLAISSDKRNK